MLQTSHPAMMLSQYYKGTTCSRRSYTKSHKDKMNLDQFVLAATSAQARAASEYKRGSQNESHQTEKSVGWVRVARLHFSLHYFHSNFQYYGSGNFLLETHPTTKANGIRTRIFAMSHLATLFGVGFRRMMVCWHLVSARGKVTIVVSSATDRTITYVPAI